MRVPENVARTVHTYLAFHAALLTVRDFNANAGERIDAVHAVP